MTNKKGQVMQNLGALGIGIVVLVLLLTITFLVMSRISTQTVDQVSATTTENESVLNWVNDTAQAIGQTCMEFSCIALYNDSANSVEVGTGNYTCAIVQDIVAQITVANSTNLNATFLWLDYSCKPPSNAYNATTELTIATAGIPGWVPLIVLVSIGGVVLVLVSGFKRR